MSNLGAVPEICSKDNGSLYQCFLPLVLQNSKESTRTKLGSVVDHYKRRGFSSECADPEKTPHPPMEGQRTFLGGGGS